MVNTDNARIAIAEMSKTLPPELVKEFANSPMLESEDLASAVLYILSTPPHVQVKKSSKVV